MNVLLRFLSLLLAVSPLLVQRSFSQTGFKGKDLDHPIFLARVSPNDSLVQLPHHFLISSSVTVHLDTLNLVDGQDYSLNARYGQLRLLAAFKSRIQPDSTVQLLIRYRALPLNFKPEYRRNELMMRGIEGDTTSRRIVSSAAASSFGDLFGPNLQKSGSIFRGFTFGSNRDLSLSSGFRMQLSGKLSEDVELVAALTDENSPIQPEGSTQTLQEVDKVFVELQHPTYGATLGDFMIEQSKTEGGEFGRFARKVQGARGVARASSLGSVLGVASFSIAAATNRGKFHNNQFQGIEGAQGPYRLSGRNGERRIIVIAGSERVYLNGELMTRGETNDYVIDYAAAEVTFSSKRLITNASRISIDFEYSDRNYTRNLFASTTSVQSEDKSFSLNASVLQEADDPDSPIDVALDETSKFILQRSGDDRLKSSISGIRFVGNDSASGLPLGQYLLQDTVIAGRSYSILVYAPGDPEALYSANFSIVDRMPADSAGYERVGVGHFRFAGIGKGNYLPLQFIPLPQRHRFLNLNGGGVVMKGLSINAEYAVSEFDANRLSMLDAQDQRGTASKVTAQYEEKDVRIGSANLGSLRFSFGRRYVDRRFVAPDRFNEVEFGRKWDVDLRTKTHEELREASVAYSPFAALSVDATYGSFERQGAERSTRLEAGVKVDRSDVPRLSYRAENIRSENHLQHTSSSWLRQRAAVDYSYGMFAPGLRAEAENRLVTSRFSDSALAGSFKILEIAPRMAITQWGPMNASVEFQIRSEDSASGGRVQRALESFSQLYSWQLREWNSLSSHLNLSIRTVRFSDAFIARGNTNSEVILVRSLSRYIPLQRAVEAEIFYEFSSQRSAHLERVFVRVPRGSGNYRYLGDRNNNGIADEEEFELTRFDGDYIVVMVPSDQLFPIVELKASSRLRLYGERLVGGNGLLASIARSLSTETYLRVDERSNESDTKQIYLLNLSRFQNPATTISGSNLIQQDLHVFENKPDLSFRFRFQQRKGLVQLLSVTEQNSMRERSVRIRSQLVREIGNTTEFVNKTDRVVASGTSLRERDIFSNALSSDFSYRPFAQWEIGFRFDVSEIEDRWPGVEAKAAINEQSVRVVYAVFGLGQFRIEGEREEVIVLQGSSSTNRPFVFEFTGGRVIGKTLLWQVAFDYRIGQNVQVTLQYNGRTEGGRSPLHFARAEARAFF
ncbi:MAG TPA: hypothetical protein VNN76_01030 [Bacteroidota bacterium]|nr:hypothetical protein [Bacteroidota bacterium]